MKKITTVVLLLVLAGVTVPAQNNDRRFELKSGVIVQTTELFGRQLIVTDYFDDYGDKYAEYTVVPSYRDGERKDSLVFGSVLSDGILFFVDHMHKVLRTQGGSSESINFLNLTTDIKKKYKIKRLGEENVCGKPCVKYSLLLEDKGKHVKTQVWVWKGVTLKKQVLSFPMSQEVEAIDIQVDVPIDSSVFIVPDYPMKPWTERVTN